MSPQNLLESNSVDARRSSKGTAPPAPHRAAFAVGPAPGRRAARGRCRLGCGRSASSEKEAPNLFVNLVGMKWMRGGATR
jgi:hypothetical protein